MRKAGIVLMMVLLFSGCEKVLMEEEPGDDPVSNFESLWNTANEKYSFFEYKGIDWNAVYSDYRPQITSDMNNYQLFCEYDQWNSLCVDLLILENIIDFNKLRYIFENIHAI